MARGLQLGNHCYTLYIGGCSYVTYAYGSSYGAYGQQTMDWTVDMLSIDGAGDGKRGNEKRRTGKRGNIMCMDSET